MPIGIQIANVGRQAAHVGTILAAASAIPTGLNALPAPLAAARGYATDDPYLKSYAIAACVPVLASLSAFGAAYSVERLMAWYLQAQGRASVTKAARVAELGTTEACLDAAINMVTVPDAETPGPEMNEGERIALAMDLMHLATADRSRLPPDLWRAASGARDAGTLVSNLLAAARSRALSEASTSSGG